MKTENPMYMPLGNHEHNRGILSMSNERWYYEVDEKRVVETAVHTNRYNIHGMVYNR